MATLTYAQIEDLWTRNGGNPLAAPVMAAIALAESGGRTDALNTKPPDYSVGLWQVNYYGSLGPSRTAAYGAPTQLAANPDAQAKAAVAISGNGTNLKPWSTYTSGAYRRFLDSNAIPALPSLTQAPGGPQLETSGQGQTYDEGTITMPSILPNIPRAVLRRVGGGAVLVGSAVIGGAGLFLLLGRRLPAASPVGAVQGLVERRRDAETERRAAAATQTPDELRERRNRRARERRGRDAATESRAAVAEGRRAADEAGSF